MPEKYSKIVHQLGWPWWVFELIIWFGIALSGSLHVYGHLRGNFFLTSSTGIVFMVLLYGSFIEPRFLTVKRFEVGKGERSLTIAYLSDLHVGAYRREGWMHAIVKKVSALNPDLVLLGGDYLLEDAKDAKKLMPLKDLRAKLGVCGVLGNHDDYYGRQEIVDVFAAMKIPLLVNEAARFSHAGRMIAVAGVDDDWYGDTAFKSSIAGIMPDDLLIMLIHNPEVATHAAKETGLRPALMLSGHDHGGQIRLPFIGSVMHLPHNLGRLYDRGLFYFDGVPLIIGQGVGESGPRARLFCPPQIVHVTLRF